MFYECREVGGGDILIRLDNVDIMRQSEHSGRPTTGVKFTGGNFVSIEGPLNEHINKLTKHLVPR